MNKEKVDILVIIGHSGSGKSSLAKVLGGKYGFKVLGFSAEGRILSNLKKHDRVFREINDNIYQNIIDAVKKESFVIVEGLASEYVFNKLLRQVYKILTIYLELPYELRIKRIAIRDACSIQTAMEIEHAKAMGKGEAGIAKVIAQADYTLDGQKTVWQLVEEIEEILKKVE